MTREDTLEVLKALTEQEANRKLGSNIGAWITIIAAAASLGAMVWVGTSQLDSVTRAKTAGEARLNAAIEDKESQITVLQNVIRQTTVKLTDKDQAILELRFIIEEIKEAAGIAEAGRVLLTLADDNRVEFDRSQTELTEAQKIKLAENFVLLRYARNFPNFGIRIMGHTDDTWDRKPDHSQSSKDKNRALSLRRATAVKQFLVKHGMPDDKIQVEGRGMLWPRGVTEAADDATITDKNPDEPARQANRRVEVLVTGVDLNAPTARRAEAQAGTKSERRP